MIKWFISHQWKKATRSKMFNKNLVVNIILGFFVFLLFLEFLVGGIFLGDKWHTLFPDDDPVSKFNSYLLYYFAMDFVIRFFMQNVPVLVVQPYLHLPIRKSSIVHYVLGKAALSVFNYLPLLVFIPIAIFQVAGNHDVNTAWVWILSLFLLIMTNNYLLVYMKKQLVSKPKVVGIFGLSIVMLMLLDRFNIIVLSDVSSSIFDSIISNQYYLIIPLLLFGFIYNLNYRFLRSHLYLEEVSIRKDKKIDNVSDWKYLKSLGQVGEIISLDIRLFLRHKRTKSIIYMTPIFLLYGFFLYPNPEFQDSWYFKIFVGWFITGGLMFNYLNYAFSYESNYFDAILSHNIDMHLYMRVKIIMAMLISTFCYVITIPYVFYGTEILFINTAVFIYNIGFTSFILLYVATFNKARMDLSKGAAFNYQGMGASNWLAILPAMLLPILIFLPFNLAGMPYIGISFIGILGVIGLLFNKSIVEFLVKQFNKRRYVMAEGFREK